MGNWFSAQVNQQKQTTTNDIYQRSEQLCSASCSNIQSGNTIFLDGTTTGDIEFVQECEANAGCMMENAVDTVMEILQDIKQGNATEAGLFPNFGSVNLNLSDQELRNQVTQILNTVCSADIENSQTDNMLYARNSNTGNISFRQAGNAQANCVMSNVANANLNLKQQGDQNNRIAGLSLGGLLGLIIAIIIIAVIIGIIRKNTRGEGGLLGDQGNQDAARKDEQARAARQRQQQQQRGGQSNPNRRINYEKAGRNAQQFFQGAQQAYRSSSK